MISLIEAFKFFALQANTTARELQKRSEQLERINAELKSKLDELTALYDASQRDNRNKAAEIVRLNHELDKLRDQKEQLARDNKKLGGWLIENHNISTFKPALMWKL